MLSKHERMIRIINVHLTRKKKECEPTNSEKMGFLLAASLSTELYMLAIVNKIARLDF